MCPGDLYFPVGEGNSLDIDIIEPENKPETKFKLKAHSRLPQSTWGD